MSDIVGWLDDVAVVRIAEAADEIERLRLNVFGLTVSDHAKSDIIRELHAKIERLQAALEDLIEYAELRDPEAANWPDVANARAALGEDKP